MQKKLIALAVAGMASTAAFAQSNVTVYGQLNPSFDSIKVDGGETRNNTFSNNNSLIGFKGEEALGNGLKAIFQVESGVSITSDRGTESQGGVFGGRDSWVGLAGSFGSLTVGKHQSAYVRSTASYDNFANSVGDYNNIMGLTGLVNGDPVADLNTRWSRSVYYTSPNWSGFQVLASYALADADETNASKAENVLSLAGTYNNGGLGIVAAYEEQGQRARVGGAPNQGDIKGWKLGANYKFAFGTTLRGIYENIQIDNVQQSGFNADSDRIYISATHPLTSNLDLNGSYIRANESINNFNDGATNYNLGVNYKFSKRTSIQGIYTHLKNKENGTFAYDSNGYNGVAGAKADGFSVRVSHSF